MGTNNALIGKRRFAGLKRLFLLNFLLILSGTFLITCIAEGFLLSMMRYIDHAMPVRLIASLILLPSVLGLPFVFLGLAAFLFAHYMGRRINRPVDELMLAVEKIRQRDLSFHIEYDKPDELGDLCRAFTILRGELQESLEREWRRQEDLRATVAALSHDLRTPVAVIQGHVEGLQRVQGEQRSERLERYLPVLTSCSQRMVRLLNDMLLMSALEQTDFLIQPQSVDLNEALAAKARLYELRATEQRISFYTQIQAAVDTTVMLDFHRVEQVLDNLFQNALRHTPSGGHIHLDCYGDRRQLTVSLRDSGPGISQADLPHIFEKFYRGQSQSSDRHKSSGLGLYICKLLVEKQGGTICVDNHPEGGCVASFFVPISSGAGTPIT